MSGPCISHTHVQVALLSKDYLRTSRYVRVLLCSLHSQLGYVPKLTAKFLSEFLCNVTTTLILVNFKKFASWLGHSLSSAYKKNRDASPGKIIF